ncbi:MAG: TolC family protein [Chitinophagaceae bacterium]
MKHIVFFSCISLLFNNLVTAQDKWDLKRCVEFAVANNISVKQADIQARISELTLNQSRLQQYPNVSFSNSTGISSGRSIDPTSNQFTNQQLLFSQFNLNTSVTIFNWFNLKNTIAGNQLSAEAARADIEKLKNDISLNVASGYLLVLVSKEQANIANVAVQQTLQSLDNTRKRVEAGSLPELNLAELEAQLARDSSTLITALASIQQNTLQLKALLNLDAAVPFEVETPPLDKIPVESLADLQPEIVYGLALANLPQQKINNLRIQAAHKYLDASKAAMYPSIAAFGGMGTNYANNKIPNFTQQSTGAFLPTPAKVSISGTDYFVQTPVVNTIITTSRTPIGTQISDNFRQNVGISINVPIFNNGFGKTQWQKNKLTVQNLELQKEQAERTLKQDIYKSYTDATTAVQKYNAGVKSVSTAEKAYNFAQKRYDVGLLSTIDFLTNQNNLTRSKLELALAQVDYVFRLKLLEFYKGQGIKLQ